MITSKTWEPTLRNNGQKDRYFNNWWSKCSSHETKNDKV